VVSARDPYGRILAFLDRSRYFFFQAAPQLYIQDRVDPVPDPLLLRESDSAENRTRTSGAAARNSDHLTIEEVYRVLLKRINFTSRVGCGISRQVRADGKQPVLCDSVCWYKSAVSVFVHIEVRDALLLNSLLLHLNSIFVRSVAGKNSRPLSLSPALCHFP
jgi:hypothetical protein